MNKTIKLILCILIAQTAGVLGSLATVPSIPGWYASLNKPPLNPPNWVFGPVWLLLFCLIGVSLYLIVQTSSAEKEAKTQAYIFFGLQLILNTAWSLLFFGLKNLPLAMAEILILWGAILSTLIRFWQINKLAGKLFIPYLLWVSFAAYLNFGVMLAN